MAIISTIQANYEENPQVTIIPHQWKSRYGYCLCCWCSKSCWQTVRLPVIDLIYKSQNAIHLFHIPHVLFKTEMCTFLFCMEHCRIWNCCIPRFVKLVYCNNMRCRQCHFNSLQPCNEISEAFCVIFIVLETSPMVSRVMVSTTAVRVYHRTESPDKTKYIDLGSIRTDIHI